MYHDSYAYWQIQLNFSFLLKPWTSCQLMFHQQIMLLLLVDLLSGLLKRLFPVGPWDHIFYRNSSFSLHLFHLHVLTTSSQFSKSILKCKVMWPCSQPVKSLLTFLKLMTYIFPAQLQPFNGCKCLPSQSNCTIKVSFH